MPNKYNGTGTLVVACVLLAIAAVALLYSPTPHSPDHPQDFVIKNDSACCRTIYLEYKSDGTVWALWPDGRFIQVVPAK